MRHFAAALLIVALAACNSQPEPNLSGNGVSRVGSAPEQVASPAPGPVNVTDVPNTPGQRNQPQTSVVDPKSPEAAAAVVQTFAQELEQHRLDQAFDMLSGNQDKAAFMERFGGLKTIHAAVGKATDSEGAAGSIYTTVQLTLTGNKDNGEAYSMVGPVALRRVNDVPGSTEAQRRWHIERIDWKASS